MESSTCWNAFSTDLPIAGEIGVVLGFVLVQFGAIEPAIKDVWEADGPRDQTRLDESKRCLNRSELSNPALALKVTCGKNAP